MIQIGKPKQKQKEKYDFQKDYYAVRIHADTESKSRTKIEMNSSMTNDWGTDNNQFITWGTDENTGNICLIKHSEGADIIQDDLVSHFANKPFIQFTRAYFNKPNNETFDITGYFMKQEVDGIGTVEIFNLTDLITEDTPNLTYVREINAVFEHKEVEENQFSKI